MNGRHASPVAAALRLDGPYREKSWFAAAALALLLAAVSAFGTDRVDIVPRTFYWALLITVAFLLRHMLARALPFGNFGRRALSVAILTAAMTPIVWGANALMLRTPLTLLEMALLLPHVAMVGLALEMLMALARGRNGEAAPPAAAVPQGLHPFLPLPLRSSMIEALEAEDHYVRVHTDRGAALLRMRFADAVSRMEGIAGIRTHRSWWINEKAVRDVRRQGSRAFLLLACGAEAPVSRTVSRELGASVLTALTPGR